MPLKTTLIFCLALSVWVKADSLFDFRSIGCHAYHSTNLDKRDYRSLNGWFDCRVALTQSFFAQTLFCSATVSHGPRENAYENRAIVGLGIENYMLSKCLPRSIHSVFPFLHHLRCFADASRLFYSGEELPHFSETNLRAGVDVWYEYNIPAIEVSYVSTFQFWYDLWSQWVYRSTGFGIEDYDTVSLNALVHAGLLQTIPDTPFIPMPYLLCDVALSGKQDFWENRMVAGVGFRFYPLKNNSKILERLMLFIEYRQALCYFKDQPSPLLQWNYTISSIPKRIRATDRPRYDLRFGVSYCFGNWWNRK